MNTKKFKVAVLGCGNAGAMYNIKNSKSKLILSHCKAFYENKKFDLLCCVDPDKNKLINVKQFYNLKYVHNSIESLLKSRISFDVISICTPIDQHYRNIKQIIKLKPKIIFCEKPIASNIKDAKKIVKMCKEHHIGLIVNFSRRWDSQLEKFKQNLNSNKFKNLKSINIKFNNGLLNYGSHMIDTLLYIFDDNFKKFKKVQLLDNDISSTLIKMFYDKTPIYICIEKDNDSSLFEIIFNFKNYQVMMLNGGRVWSYRKVVKDSDIKNNLIYSDFKFQKGSVLTTLSLAVSEISRILESNSESKYEGITAFQSQLLCDKILKIIQN